MYFKIFTCVHIICLIEPPLIYVSVLRVVGDITSLTILTDFWASNNCEQCLLVLFYFSFWKWGKRKTFFAMYIRKMLSQAKRIH